MNSDALTMTTSNLVVRATSRQLFLQSSHVHYLYTELQYTFLAFILVPPRLENRSL